VSSSKNIHNPDELWYTSNNNSAFLAQITKLHHKLSIKTNSFALFCLVSEKKETRKAKKEAEEEFSVTWLQLKTVQLVTR